MCIRDSYKGKAEGSNSNEGLWAASPAHTKPADAKDIYWFESAYEDVYKRQAWLQARNRRCLRSVQESCASASRLRKRGRVSVPPLRQ